jgi:hypothetical protein
MDLKYLELVKARLSALYREVGKLSRFGATDSEVQYNIEKCIRDAAMGRTPDIPQTASAWELFSMMEGAEVAALTLTTEARALFRWFERFRDECPVSAWPMIEDYLGDRYCYVSLEEE